MAHGGQEAPLGLGHFGPFLRSLERVFRLHLSGHVPLAQKHAGLACDRVQHLAGVEVVPAQSGDGAHLAQFREGLSRQHAVQGGRAMRRVGEAIDERALAFAIGGEGGRIGEGGTPVAVEQGDQAGGVAQRLHRP